MVSAVISSTCRKLPGGGGGVRLRFRQHSERREALVGFDPGQKYLRPAAVKAGVIAKDQKIRFGFHNFRRSLASALVKMKIDGKTVQEFLRQAHVTTTLKLHAQSDMESKRDTQGKFLEQLVGERMHLLAERVQ